MSEEYLAEILYAAFDAATDSGYLSRFRIGTDGAGLPLTVTIDTRVDMLRLARTLMDMVDVRDKR